MSLTNDAPRIHDEPSNPFRQSIDQRQTLDQLERLGTWLDSSIPVPGTKFKIGWDTLIGLIPGVGDAATAAISSWIVWQAKQMGVSKWTLARMIANVGIDTLVGAIPLAGDVFDAAYKSNQKNISLLRRQLEKQMAASDHLERSTITTSD